MNYAALPAPTLQNGQAVSVSTTSAQSTALLQRDYLVTVTALVFVMRGTNPTAVSGTSMALAPNIPYVLKGIQENDKLAFVAPTGTASAYLTPLA